MPTTGEPWTPAEVQETVWSVTKHLYETGTKKGESRLMADILEAGDITGETVADIADFGTLLQEDIYSRLLKEGGYGQQLEGLAGRSGGTRGGAQSVYDPQGAGIAGPTYQRHLRDFGGRLDELKRSRGDASSLKLIDEAWTGGARPTGHPASKALPQSYRPGHAGSGRRDLGRGIGVIDSDDVRTLHSPVEASAEALRKAGGSAPDFLELKPTRANAEKFQRALKRAKKKSKHGAAVHVYPVEDYAQSRMFLTPDGTAGFALKGDVQDQTGELRAVDADKFHRGKTVIQRAR